MNGMAQGRFRARMQRSNECGVLVPAEQEVKNIKHFTTAFIFPSFKIYSF
jgi:hypothetical protein